jgi:hypothetical protein
MNPETHFKLINALTQYDIKQSTKAGYNRYALPQYYIALGNVEQDMNDNGMTLRQAILTNFVGRLADVCLKSVGEVKATKEELR